MREVDGTAPVVADPRTRTTALLALGVGAVLLAVTLGLEDGSAGFYLAGFALAATWLVGHVVARPERRLPGRLAPMSRWSEAAIGVAAGAACYGIFVVAAYVVDDWPGFGSGVDSLLDAGGDSPLVLVLVLAGVNAVAEELFFRGTLMDAAPARLAFAAGVVPSTVAAAFSLNVALIAASLVMCSVFAAERLATGRLTASICTHLTWSTLVILAFPR